MALPLLVKWRTTDKTPPQGPRFFDYKKPSMERMKKGMGGGEGGGVDF
jgi:hypothetical protein